MCEILAAYWLWPLGAGWNKLAWRVFGINFGRMRRKVGMGRIVGMADIGKMVGGWL